MDDTTDPVQEMRELVASRVLEARRTRELTMEQAAEVGGVSHVTWRRIENAQKVKPGTYAAVDHFLGLSIGTTGLMVERGEVPPDENHFNYELYEQKGVDELLGDWEHDREEYVKSLFLSDPASTPIHTLPLVDRLAAIKLAIDMSIVEFMSGTGLYNRRALYEAAIDLLNRLEDKELKGMEYLLKVARMTRDKEREWSLPPRGTTFRPEEKEYRKLLNPWLGSPPFEILYTGAQVKNTMDLKDIERSDLSEVYTSMHKHYVELHSKLAEAKHDLDTLHSQARDRSEKADPDEVARMERTIVGLQAGVDAQSSHLRDLQDRLGTTEREG